MLSHIALLLKTESQSFVKSDDIFVVIVHSHSEKGYGIRVTFGEFTKGAFRS